MSLQINNSASQQYKSDADLPEYILHFRGIFLISSSQFSHPDDKYLVWGEGDSWAFNLVYGVLVPSKNLISVNQATCCTLLCCIISPACQTKQFFMPLLTISSLPCGPSKVFSLLIFLPIPFQFHKPEEDNRI